MKQALTILLVWLATISCVYSNVYKGTASSGNGFQFLGKFCFDYNPSASGNYTSNDASGLINLEMTATGVAPLSMRVYLYSDEAGSWDEVYKNRDSWTCAQKIAKAKPSSDLVTFGTDKKFVLRDHYIHQGVRPRFWFVALANCDETGGPGFNGIDYELHMVNNRQGPWNKEFGVNVRGLNTLYATFFAIFTILIIIQFFSVGKLFNKLKFMHPLVKLFLVVLIWEYGSVILNLVHFAAFTNDGIGYYSLFRIAEVLETLARICFLLLLLLLAKGWTISGGTLQGNMKWIIAGVLLFAICYVGIIIWKFAIEDPAETSVPDVLFVFQTAASAVWLTLAIWFAVSIYMSWSKEFNPVKKGLYGRLGLFYTPWFGGLPAIVFIAYVLSPWVRDKGVTMLQLGVSTIAYVIMMFLTWHSRAVEYFDIAKTDTFRGGFESYDQL